MGGAPYRDGGAPPESWDDVAARLRTLRHRAGNPSYSDLAAAVAALRERRGSPERASRTAVYDCFRPGRVRMDLTLLDDLGAVLGLDEAEARAWSDSCFAVQNRLDAAQLVTVEDAPLPTASFVGRERELAALRASVPGMVVLAGIAGSGKTQLALRAAGERVLLVALRGYDEARPPADPAAVRHEVLRVLGAGLGVRQQPAAEQRERLAAALADAGRVLVLDDAASAEQVREVIGGTDLAGQVLVTSRLRLDELDAVHVVVGPLDAEAAVMLLQGAGRTLAADDRLVAGELATALGGHPLALELVARQIADRPDWPLHEHLAALRSQQALLHLPAEVAASLGRSLRDLGPEAGRALRLVAEQPCARLPDDAVGALVGPESEELLAALRTAHLVSRDDDGVRMHDLVRLAARAWGLSEDRPSVRAEARDRLLEHYLDRAERSVVPIGMTPYTRAFVVPEGATAAAPVDEAWAWLARERDNLVTLADPRHAAHRPDVTIRLSVALSRYLEAQAAYAPAVVLHRWAVALAVRSADASAELGARAFLAAVLARVGEVDEALAEAQVVLDRGDPREVADAMVTVHNARGVLAAYRGDLDEALAEFLAALGLVEAGPTARSSTSLLSNVGAVLTYLGRVREAIDYQQRALDQARAAEDWGQVLPALTNLVDNHLTIGAPERALALAEEACALGEQYGFNTAVSRTNLGLALTAQGRHDEARAAHRQALVEGETIGDRDLVASVHNNLADLELAVGDHAAARSGYAAALAAAVQKDGLEGTRARAGLDAVSG